MQVNRKQLLSELESILPGLSAKEEIEQSSCVVFQKGHLYTYNDEISCSRKTSLNITGAVQAVPLINLLRKLSEEMIEITTTESELCVKGKRRKAGITFSAEISLAIETVEEPGKWKTLPKEFIKAAGLTSQCSGKDDSRFALTCIHITPDYLEACDNFQCSRYIMANKIKKPFLIRSEVVSHLKSSQVTKFSESESWVHFKNDDGLTLSCRRYIEKFPDLNDILSFKGNAVVLPKDVNKAVERAEVFSSDSDDSDNLITIALSTDSLIIAGEGTYGWLKEKKKVKYSGPELSFRISPSLFTSIIQKKNKCTVSESRIKIQLDAFLYVAALSMERTK
jgi:hypothetical protein